MRRDKRRLEVKAQQKESSNSSLVTDSELDEPDELFYTILCFPFLYKHFAPNSALGLLWHAMDRSTTKVEEY